MSPFRFSLVVCLFACLFVCLCVLIGQLVIQASNQTHETKHDSNNDQPLTDLPVLWSLVWSLLRSCGGPVLLLFLAMGGFPSRAFTKKAEAIRLSGYLLTCSVSDPDKRLCRFSQDGQNCAGDSCAFGLNSPSPLQTCFGWQDSRYSDDGTSMVCYSGTTRVTWMKAVFNHRFH